MIHHLKCWPWFFDEIVDGRKTFEVRRIHDRVFQAGDQLYLSKFNPETKLYLGEHLTVDVLAVYHGLPGVSADTCVMSIRKPLSEGDGREV